MRALSTAALAAGLVVLLCAGIWLGGHPDHLPAPVRDLFVSKSVRLSRASIDASSEIRDSYYRPVPNSQLQNGSIAGMTESLRRRFKADRYTQYLDPEQTRLFDEQTSGRFAGVGLSVAEVKGGLQAIEVFQGSPAAKAGIKPGDLVVSVNDKSIAGQPINVSVAQIKGRPGTRVTLGVRRPPARSTRSITLQRAEITEPLVEPSLRKAGGEKLGYVRFATQFSEGAHAALRHAVAKLERRGAQGILLDLRGNPGGLLPEAVLTASDFLPKGATVVITDSRTEGRHLYRAYGDPLPRRPMVVLIDRFTASAAEILASALADHGLATIVGTRSFGKGFFQSFIHLPNGGALDLSVGRFFTADGVSLAPKGIQPDVYAKDHPQTAADEALRRGLAVLGGEVRSGQGQPSQR